jgi:DNA polymerase III delta prime subunit
MNSSFISKYKPYYIEDFKLDRETNITIKSLIEMNEINILIYGPSGCGKTMLLESLIREYYNLKKKQSFPEHNILYINHLKEQGIHFYRNEMKTFCQSQSIIYGKKKMILIDDLDTVNEQSQQVFRHYIDNFSKNVHFVFVCTNIQKVIESIQSRSHTIKLKPLDKTQIRDQLDHIVLNERIKISDEATEYLISSCNDSVRILI